MGVCARNADIAVYCVRANLHGCVWVGLAQLFTW